MKTSTSNPGAPDERTDHTYNSKLGAPSEPGNIHCLDCRSSDHQPDTQVSIYNPDDWEISDGPRQYCSSGHLHRPTAWDRTSPSDSNPSKFGYYSKWHKRLRVVPVKPHLTEFHCFMALPFEIRRQIWQLNFPGPRILRHEIQHDTGRDELWSFIQNIDSTHGPNGTYPAHSLRFLQLQLICVEASAVFKESYYKIGMKGSSIAKLWDANAADERSDIGGTTSIIPRHDYIDKFRDTLYLSTQLYEGPSLKSLHAWLDLERVRYLAIDSIFKQDFPYSWECISGSPSLKTFTMVLEGEVIPTAMGQDTEYRLIEPSSFSAAWLAQGTHVRHPTNLDMRNTAGYIAKELMDPEKADRWTRCRRTFLEAKPTDLPDYPSLLIDVAFLGRFWKYTPPSELKWVVPKNKKSYKSCFQAALPNVELPRYYLRLGYSYYEDWSFCCDIECEADGTYSDPVDGLERLFRDADLTSGLD